jgi:hypothetical protein
MRIYLLTLIICGFVSSSFAQCIPTFEKPFEIAKGEVLNLEIPVNSKHCADCTKLLYGQGRSFSDATVSEKVNDKFMVSIADNELSANETTIYYQLICQGSFEKGEIKVVRKENALIGENGSLFSIFVLDTEAFNQKKPFRISVKAHGFPNAMITCSGCKDIDQVEPMIYLVTPGFAGSISLTITGVTKEGDITDLGVRVLEFP